MRKIIAIVLICIVFWGNIASANTKTIDLEHMTIEELEELINEVENEKRKATEVSYKSKEILETDFMKTVEALFPEGTKFSYPFFGLSIVHRRNYYCVCGTVGCKLPDKSKQNLWDATIIYWYNEAQNEFHQAAFYTKDKFYFADENALQQVETNLEPIARENLIKHNISIITLGTVSSTISNETDKSTPTPIPASTITPTLEPVPTATLFKQGSFSFGSTKTKDNPEESEQETSGRTENEDKTSDANDTYSSMFKDIASGGTVLDLQEVLHDVPDEFNPLKYDHMYVYYFTLKDGISNFPHPYLPEPRLRQASLSEKY